MESDDKEVMTPEHPRWSEFTERLGGPEGCDWTDDGWRCGGTDYPFAREILGGMLGDDVEGSIDYSPLMVAGAIARSC